MVKNPNWQEADQLAIYYHWDNYPMILKLEVQSRFLVLSVNCYKYHMGTFACISYYKLYFNYTNKRKIVKIS